MMSNFRWPIRVYYEDTDAGGVVYHASYVRFYERARTEWLRQADYQQHGLLTQQQQGFAVVSLQLNYLKAARLDDLLHVDVNILRLGNASITLAQNIWNTKNGIDELINQAQLKLVYVDLPRMKPAIMSDALRSIFVQAQGASQTS